jgi:hypothetical protein
MEKIEQCAKGEVDVLDFLATRFDLFASNPESVRMMGWAAMQQPPMPKHIRAKAHVLKEMALNNPSDDLVPLMVVFAMDGFFQNRRLFSRAIGDRILTPEFEARMRETMLLVCHRWKEEHQFRAALAVAVEKELK